MATPINVLILEDSPTDAELIIQELRRAGFDASWRRAEAAAQYLAGLDASPDIILADYSLPQFDALKALEILKERRLDIPLIVVTGTLGDEAAVHLIKEGAADYLLKDRLARLPQAVSAALESKRLRQQQREAARQLQESEVLYRTVVENANDGISLIVDGKVVFANRSYARIYGFEEPSQIIGADPADFTLPDYREAMRRRIATTLQGQAVPGVFERKVRRTSGEVRTLQVSSTPVTYHGQHAALGVIRDVTEAKRAEEDLRESYQVLEKTLQELREAQARLVHQERLNALGQMASGIVHDFNNALTPIVGFRGLILDNPNLLDDKPKVLEYLRQCQSSAGDASAIISRLREFYRPREQTEPLVPTDLNQVVQHAMSVTEYAWRHQAVRQGIPIRVASDLGPIPAILGQGQELGRVLTNLILNAVDAMPQGGAITLRTRQHQQQVLLEVTDTGTGMPEEVRRHCFEPFFTTKGEKGTGLGLAVAYGVIQRHNGRIDMESELGKGTTFHIHLPVA